MAHVVAAVYGPDDLRPQGGQASPECGRLVTAAERRDEGRERGEDTGDEGVQGGRIIVGQRGHQEAEGEVDEDVDNLMEGM
jgi:hypothetical protein